MILLYLIKHPLINIVKKSINQPKWMFNAWMLMAIQGQGSGWRLWKPSSAVQTSHAGDSGDSIVCNRNDHNVVDPIRNHMSNLTIQRSYTY